MTDAGELARTAPRLETFEIAGSSGRVIRGDARLVEGATASVVLVHGFKGFARGNFMPFVADRLSAAGLTTIAFDFSGSGVGADRETFTDFDAFEANSIGRELYDLLRVMRLGEERGWLGERRGLWGHSRGGGVSVLHAARDTRLGALVTWSAIATVERWSAEDRETWRRLGYLEVLNTRTKQTFRLGRAMLEEIEKHAQGRLHIERAAAQVRCPWLIVHGDVDETVPIEEGERLRQASREHAELLHIPGASHAFNVSHGFAEASPALLVATDRTVRFFVEALGRGPE
jgi:dienelactone hydrolase